MLTHYRGFSFPPSSKFKAYLDRLLQHPDVQKTCSTEQLYLDSYERYVSMLMHSPSPLTILAGMLPIAQTLVKWPTQSTLDKSSHERECDTDVTFHQTPYFRCDVPSFTEYAINDMMHFLFTCQLRAAKKPK